MTLKARLMAISRRLKIVGVIIFILIIAAGAYQLYGIWRESTGMNPSKTVKAYFVAFSQQDYNQVYALTAKGDLTDIYGRQITEGEFIAQLKKLTGAQPLPFTSFDTSKLFETRGRLYYSVTLHSLVGKVEGKSRLVVEVRKEGLNWVVTFPFGIVL
ncbi:MAG: hypothetical protein ACYCZF_09205 [Anaerolineae bacterium]